MAVVKLDRKEKYIIHLLIFLFFSFRSAGQEELADVPCRNAELNDNCDKYCFIPA